MFYLINKRAYNYTVYDDVDGTVGEIDETSVLCILSKGLISISGISSKTTNGYTVFFTDESYKDSIFISRSIKGDGYIDKAVMLADKLGYKSYNLDIICNCSEEDYLITKMLGFSLDKKSSDDKCDIYYGNNTIKVIFKKKLKYINGIFLGGFECGNIIIKGLDLSMAHELSLMFVCVTADEIKFENVNFSNIKNIHNMFDNCTITKVDLSNTDFSDVEFVKLIASETFIHELDLSGCDFSNARKFSSAFEGCSITDLKMNGMRCGKLKTMANMFSDFIGDYVEMDFDTSGVSDMSMMFSHAKIKKVILDKLDTSSVVTMESMFLDCKTSRIDVSGMDTGKVKTMTNMFSLVHLDSLDLSNFNTSNVINMSGMFKESEIGNLNISSFKLNKSPNMSNMFSKFNSDILDLSMFNIANAKVNRVFYKVSLQKLRLNSSLLNKLSVSDFTKAHIGSIDITDEENISNSVLNILEYLGQ